MVIILGLIFLEVFSDHSLEVGCGHLDMLHFFVDLHTDGVHIVLGRHICNGRQ